MKKRIISLLMAVMLIANINEFSYLTVQASSTTNQTIMDESTDTLDETGEADSTNESTTNSKTNVTEGLVEEINESIPKDSMQEVEEDTPIEEKESQVQKDEQTEEQTEENEIIPDVVNPDTTIVFTYEEIKLGQEMALSTGVSERNYLFTPSEDGWYDLSVEGEGNAYVYLYSIDLVTKETSMQAASNGDTDLFYYLSKGTNYFIKVSKNIDYRNVFQINPMKTITEINVTSPTESSILSEENGLNLIGMEMTVSYSDGTTSKVTNQSKSYFKNYMGQSVLVNFDNQPINEGIYQATVTYMGISTTVDIQFIRSNISRIEIVTYPQILDYYKPNKYAESLQLDGLVFRAYSEDGKVLGDYTYNEFRNEISSYIITKNNEYISNFTKELDSGNYDFQIRFRGCEVSTKDTPIHIYDNNITGIEIAKQPDKTTYYDLVDTYLSLSGLQIKVNYMDKESELIDTNNRNFRFYMEDSKPFELLSPSETPYHLIFEYMGYSVSQDIYIKDTPVENVKIIKNPTKTTYIANGEYDLSLSGIKIEVTFKDGREKEIISGYSRGLDGYAISYNRNNIDWEKVGTQAVEVTYMGVPASYNIELTENTVKSISVKNLPTKTQYYAVSNNHFDKSGLSIEVLYNDGTTKIIDAYYDTNVRVSFQGLSSIGEKTVTVNYLGAKTTFKITVVENPVKSISIHKLPKKTTYYLGVDTYVSTDEIELLVEYEDETKIVKEFDNPYLNVVDANTVLGTIGNKLVTVEYMNCQATYSITVEESPVKSIEVTRLPKQIDYIAKAHSYVNFNGIQMSVLKKDGSTETFSSMYTPGNYRMEVDYSKVNFNKIGTYEVYITYMGSKTSFNINIVANPVTGIEISQLPSKTEYIVKHDDNIQLYGLQIKLIKETESTILEYEEADEYSITTNESEIDWETTGTKTVTVYYMGYEANFNIEVIDNPVSSILLDVKDAKTSYYAGCDTWIDTNDILLTVKYKEGTDRKDKTVLLDDENYEVVFNDTDSPRIPKDISPGLYPVTVRYMDVENSYNITIVPSPVESIEIIESPNKISYYNFEEDFDLSGLKIRINYNNGKESDILSYSKYQFYLNGYWVYCGWKNVDLDEEDGIKYPAIGENAITLTYMGCESEIPVKVLTTPVKNIEVTSIPVKVYNKLWYSDDFSSSSIDLSGLQMEITYEDDSKHIFKIEKDNKNDSRIVDDSYNRRIYADFEDNQIQIKYMNQIATYPFYEEEADWTAVNSITLDTPTVSNITTAKEGIIYQFTPTVSGIYRIYSYGGFDSFVTLYDNFHNYINDDDDDGEGYNFSLSEELEQGKTYYIVVNAFDISTFHTVISKEGSEPIETKTAIKDITVGDVIKPVVGEIPSNSVTVENDSTCYINNISWSGITSREEFKAATKYTINITFKAETGFGFTTATNATINGKRVTAKKYNSNGTFTISYTFDYTDCFIEFPTSNDYEIIGEKTVPYGENYTFRIQYRDGYDSSNNKVKANGILLVPVKDIYTLPNVKENQVIAIKNINGTNAALGEHSVLFYNNGELYDILYVKGGSKVSALKAPENVLPVIESTDSNFFLGWYDAKGERFTSNTTVQSNIELTAKWCDRVITSMYNGYTIYYKILSIDENNRMKVQVSTGTQVAANQVNPNTNIGLIDPLRGSVESTIIVPPSFTSEVGDVLVSCDVVSVGNNAFSNSTVSNIILPNTIESIGSGAFEGCTSLTNILIPQGVKTIEQNTFSGCTSLTQVVLPEGITEVEDNAFNGCQNLQSVTIPSTIQAISDSAFQDTGTEQSKTEFYCNPEAMPVLNNAGIDSDKIIAVTLTLDYEYSDLKLEAKQSKVISVSGVEGTTDISDQVTWTSSNKDSVSISSEKGKSVTLFANASTENTTVVASYKGITTSIQVAVTSHNLEDDETISIQDLSNQIYTGKELTPSIIVKKGSETLLKDTDYEVAYQDNINVGKATVIIRGKGIYEGIVTKTFSINPEGINSCSILDVTSYNYTGNEITPTLTINHGSKALVKGTDYEATYTNNTNVGTAKIKITGKGNYTGTVTKEFSIKGADISKFTVKDIGPQIYTGSPINPAITIVSGSITLSNNIDYDVTYSNNTNVGTAQVSIKGKGNYFGTLTTTFGIASKNIENTTVEAMADKWYTGVAIEPTPTLKDGKITLVKDKDYTLTYQNNTKAGKANIIITGKGNYSGSKNVNFKIISSLDKVIGVTAENIKKSNIELKWQEVANAHGYEVYQYNTSKKKYVKIGSTTKNGYNSKKLSQATTYTYKVRAYAKVNGKTIYGSYSNVFKTGTCTANPTIKVKLSKKNATISWKQVKGAAGYEIYMSTSKNGTYSKIGTTTKGNKISFTKKNLKKGTYYFKVNSYIKVGKIKIYSGYSSVKSIKVK